MKRSAATQESEQQQFEYLTQELLLPVFDFLPRYENDLETNENVENYNKLMQLLAPNVKRSKLSTLSKKLNVFLEEANIENINIDPQLLGELIAVSGRSHWGIQSTYATQLCSAILEKHYSKMDWHKNNCIDEYNEKNVETTLFAKLCFSSSLNKEFLKKVVELKNQPINWNANIAHLGKWQALTIVPLIDALFENAPSILQDILLYLKMRDTIEKFWFLNNTEVFPKELWLHIKLMVFKTEFNHLTTPEEKRAYLIKSQPPILNNYHQSHAIKDETNNDSAKELSCLFTPK